MSNAEMVSVPRHTLENVLNDGSCKAEVHAAFIRARNDIERLLAHPVEQHQGEPVALVHSPRCGASWPQFESVCGKTKDGKSTWQCGECARKEAAALRIEMDKYFGLYEEADTHARHWQRQERVKARWAKQVEGELNTLRAQLAERDALLGEAKDELARGNGVSRAFTAEKIRCALSASAEPTYPRVEIVRAHKHTCASCKEGAEHAPCDCGAIVDGVAVKIEPSAALERKP